MPPEPTSPAHPSSPPAGPTPPLSRWTTAIFHPWSQASSRGEAKDSAFLSSRDADLLEPPERLQGSNQSILKEISHGISLEGLHRIPRLS